MTNQTYKLEKKSLHIWWKYSNGTVERNGWRELVVLWYQPYSTQVWYVHSRTEMNRNLYQYEHPFIYNEQFPYIIMNFG